MDERELEGRFVRLRALRESDLAQRAMWTADEELCRLMGVDPGAEPFVSQEDELASNRAWLAGRRRAGDRVYAIEAAGAYIGDIDVALFADQRRAELTVFIGRRACWGKGYGTEAVTLLLAELGRRGAVGRVDVDVAPGNARAYRFWRRLGFELVRTRDNGARELRCERGPDGWPRPAPDTQPPERE